jgi:hypothetical protein
MVAPRTGLARESRGINTRVLTPRRHATQLKAGLDPQISSLSKDGVPIIFISTTESSVECWNHDSAERRCCVIVIIVVRMLNFVIIKTETNMADFGDREMILANFQVT